jgi:2',3'-cyclic-nucleotide 2'-phosphodiesterase (5'-nucleotidase family)
MGQVIGQVAVRMEKQKPESTLGNWVADAIMTMATERAGGARIDFAIQNYGGIRIGSISPGPVTLGKVFELMPFDNLISVVEVPGTTLDSLVHRFAQSGGYPVSKELRFGIRERKAVQITVGGQPIDPNRTYTVAMPDYVANGGDRMDIFRGLARNALDYLIRDALADFIRAETRAGRSIQGRLDGRIFVTGE